MLHINNACIAFGTEVLFSGFEMKLEKGETACIVGQSGCGKTSLLNAVMGFVPLYEGTIKVGGTLLDKSTIDLVRRQIAWIPQETGVTFRMGKRNGIFAIRAESKPFRSFFGRKAFYVF